MLAANATPPSMIAKNAAPKMVLFIASYPQKRRRNLSGAPAGPQTQSRETSICYLQLASRFGVAGNAFQAERRDQRLVEVAPIGQWRHEIQSVVVKERPRIASVASQHRRMKVLRNAVRCGSRASVIAGSGRKFCWISVGQ